MTGLDATRMIWLRKPAALDGAFMGIAAVLGVAGVAAELAEAARPLLPAADAYLIAIATAGMLAWRRPAPLVAAAGILALCLLYHLAGYPGLAPAVAMFFAVHAVTAYATGRRLLLATAVIGAIGLIPLLPPDPARFNVGALLGPPTGLIAAAAMGEAARARRVAVEEQLRTVRQTAAEEARRVLVEERLDIARELHDVLAHTITVIAVQAAAGADALEHRPEETRAALATVRNAARDAMTELRSTLVLLRAAETDRVAAPAPGLGRLPQLVDQACAAGVSVRLVTSGAADGLPAALELAIYRIVQEALTNTIRHSAARTAAVQIGFGRDEVTVEVIDDGPMVAAATATHDEPQPAAHGLVGMRERARALGGTLNAGPIPGSGFRVAARLPIRGST